MREQNVTIDGVPVTLIKMSAAPGFKMLARLTRILGGSLMDAAASAGKSKEEQATAFGDVIDGIVAKTTDDQLYNLINDTLCGGFVAVGGKKLTHLDDLGAIEDSDPFYLGLMIFKEQMIFSFGPAIKKLMGAQTS